MASISTQHSYIVLRQQSERFKRGALVELGSDGRYHHHSHMYRIVLGTNYTRIADSDLAPLNEEQCVILDAFSFGVRYTVYSTPSWAAGVGGGAQGGGHSAGTTS